MAIDALDQVLLDRLIRGDLDPHLILGYLRSRSQDAAEAARPPVGNLALLRLLAEDRQPAAVALANRLRQLRREQALRVMDARRRKLAPASTDLADLADLPVDAPAGWTTRQATAQHLAKWFELRCDHAWAMANQGSMLGLAERIAAALARWESSLVGMPWPWADPESLIAGLPVGDPLSVVLRPRLEARRQAPMPGSSERLAWIERGLTDASLDPSARAAQLREALAWPDERIAPLLASLVDDPVHSEAVQLTLCLRFGGRGVDPLSWKAFLREAAARVIPTPAAPPAELLLAWCRTAGETDPALLSELERHVTIPMPTEDEVLVRWGGSRVAAPVAAPAVEVKSATSVSPAAVDQAIEVGAPRPSTPPPRSIPPRSPPREPPRWWIHLHGLLGENWYLVAGILMMVAGLSVLAYYTWDKHWLVRYTIMPALLAGFTAGLGAVGGWLERRDRSLSTTAAWLRGAAIALFPANAMTVVVMGNDPTVGGASSMHAGVVGVAATAYLASGIVLARRWCRAVHPGLSAVLAPAVVALAALVGVIPAARAWPEAAIPIVVGGMYAGFLVAAVAGLHLIRRVLTAELVRARQIPWFTGAILAVVGLESVAWVHGALAMMPPWWAYGPLAILAGALVLRVERLASAERPESFVGYALILVGVVLGLPEPGMRIAVLLLAGGFWLRHALWATTATTTAVGETDAATSSATSNATSSASSSAVAFQAVAGFRIHAWIGCVALILGFAAIALLPGITRTWWPPIGLGIVGLLVGGGVVARVRPLLAEVLLHLRGTVLVVTVLVAVLVQWHDRSEPLLTAGWLIGCAGLLAVASGPAWRRTVTAMAVLAGALPYLGCADMTGHQLHGNRLVGGLAGLGLLWVAACRGWSSAPFVAARSAVLWGLGAAALAAMALRVLVEGQLLPSEGGWGLLLIDAGGPLVMGGLLFAATWWSRSLLPAFIAVGIVAVLLPGLKTELAARLHVAFGSGLGGAIMALAMAVACFPLRAATRLRELTAGDVLAPDRLFPLRRRDHTLFTWPLLTGALLLAARVDTLDLARHLPQPGLSTLAALCLTGVVWLLLAAWWQRFPGLVWLGWSALAAGSGWIFNRLVQPERSSDVLLVALALVQLGWLVVRFSGRFSGGRETAMAQTLESPTRALVLLATFLGTLLVLLAWTIGREPWPLSLALLTAGVIHALTAAPALVRQGFGWLAVVLAMLLWCVVWLPSSGATIPSWLPSGSLPVRCRQPDALAVWLGLGLAMQVLMAVGERMPAAIRERIPALQDPLRILGVLVVTVGAGLVLLLSVGKRVHGLESLLAMGGLLLAARANRSAALALVAVAVGYVSLTAEGVDQAARVQSLMQPWRLGAAALFIALIAATALRRAWLPAWLARGADPLPWLVRGAGWWLSSAVLLAGLTVLAHLGHWPWRHDPLHLSADWLAVATFAVVAWGWRQPWFALPATIASTIGCVLAVRCLAGGWLEAVGIHRLHQLCLGLGAMLGLLALSRLVTVSADLQHGRYRVGQALAWGILALLAVNWLAAHDLSAMSSGRFIASALLAAAVAGWFRLALRQAEPTHPGWSTAGALVAVAIGLWSLALLVPWLREPAWVLAALAVPATWFHLRAELTLREAAGWRIGAVGLHLMILACWVARPLFQAVVLPDAAVDALTYHANAWLALWSGLSLQRLHGLRPPRADEPGPARLSWVAYYGGLGTLVGLWFLLTWPVALSPFSAPVAAAWCAVGFCHLVLVAASRGSWLADLARDWCGSDAESWLRLRRAWGTTLFFAVAIAIGWALARTDDSLTMAPLLAGLATISAHLAMIRRSSAWWIATVALALIALHLDALVPSWLPLDHVAWILLGAWLVLLVLGQRLAARVRLGDAGLAIGALGLGHLLVHPPWTTGGLILVAGVAVLSAGTPRATRQPMTRIDRIIVVLLLGAIPWLAFWSATDAGMPTAGAVLAVAMVLALQSAIATWFAGQGIQLVNSLDRPRPLVADQLLTWIGGQGGTISLVDRTAATGLAFIALVWHHHQAWSPMGLAASLLVWSGLAWGWLRQGLATSSVLACYASQGCVVLGLATLRHHLRLTTTFWTLELDVWASLAIAVALIAGRHAIERTAEIRGAAMRSSLIGTQLALPVVALVWTILHGLGSDVALLVVGVHSLLFAHLGWRDAHSPYRLIALAGFAAFVVLVLVTQLHMTSAPAWVVPIGAAILALVQLRSDALDADARNLVRIPTLLAMLASVGWYALFDRQHSLAFHLVLLGLCLATMVMGSALRLRLVLGLGFGGLVVDLAVILVRLVLSAERTVQMSVLGGLVLLVGAVLVGGTIYVQANRERISARTASWRQRFAAWE